MVGSILLIAYGERRQHRRSPCLAFYAIGCVAGPACAGAVIAALGVGVLASVAPLPWPAVLAGGATVHMAFGMRDMGWSSLTARR